MLALLLSVLAAQGPIQPWTYRSPAGTHALFVDPTDRHGLGPARYAMTRAGEPLWERELEFTLLDALVNDDGSVVGYAYPDGDQPHSKVLVVARVAPDGSIGTSERVAQSESESCGGWSSPRVRRMVRTPEGFALEVGRGSTPLGWWLYDGASMSRTDQLDAPAAATIPVGLPRGRVGAETSFPSIDLSVLGHVNFPWPVPSLVERGDPSYETFRQRRPHLVCLDSEGRIWISELSTRIVHVFDPAGMPLFEREPDPAHFQPYHPPDWIALRDDGSLFLPARDAIEETGPRGEHVGRIPIPDGSSVRWLFQPRTRRRWAVSFGRVELGGADGEVRRVHERGAAPRWLESLGAMAMAEDGALVVLDSALAPESRDPVPWLHVFTPEGDALRSYRLPAAVHPHALAFERGRIALVGGRDLWMLSEEGEPLLHTVLPAQVGDAPWTFFFSPSGDELWVFPHHRAEMLRFGCPARGR